MTARHQTCENCFILQVPLHLQVTALYSAVLLLLLLLPQYSESPARYPGDEPLMQEPSAPPRLNAFPPVVTAAAGIQSPVRTAAGVEIQGPGGMAAGIRRSVRTGAAEMQGLSQGWVRTQAPMGGGLHQICILLTQTENDQTEVQNSSGWPGGAFTHGWVPQLPPPPS